MYVGKTLSVQIMDFLTWKTFQRIVTRYNGDYRIRTLSCVEQFLILAFAQLIYRESESLVFFPDSSLRGNAGYSVFKSRLDKSKSLKKPVLPGLVFLQIFGFLFERYFFQAG